MVPVPHHYFAFTDVDKCTEKWLMRRVYV